MKNIIVFGRNGFISKKLIMFFKNKKIKTQSLGRKEIDLTKENSINLIKKKVKKNSIIIFISAIAPVKNVLMFNKNIKMIEIFLKGIKEKNIKHFIYISSDAVYSDSKQPISESSICEPSSLHGNMHLVRENILKNYFKNKIAILRPTLIYGKEDTHNGYGPNQFMRSSLKNKRINIFGNGEEIRDHIHVDDICEIIFNCVKKKFNGILNLVTGYKISFLSIAKAIIKKNNNGTVINKLKRKGPMPHNGYRVFDNKKLIKFMKGYKFNKIQLRDNYINY